MVARGPRLVHRFPVDTYGQQLTLLVNLSWEQVQAYIVRRFPNCHVTEDSRADGCAFTIENQQTGAVYRFVWVVRFTFRLYEQAMLVHEVLHHVHAVLRDAGMTLSDETEEAYAYYFQSVYQDALSVLCRSQRKRKKR